MKRLWVLAWKEVKLSFRDVGGIITMLVSPLVLTLVIGAAFSGGGSNPLEDIPVLLLDQDGGEFSEMLLDVFEIDDVRAMIALEPVPDTTEAQSDARARVEMDEVAALIVIPEGFSDRVLPLVPLVQDQLGLDLFTLDPETPLSEEQQRVISDAYFEAQEMDAEPVVIEIYASPEWRLSTSVVKSVVQQALEIMNIQVQGISVIIDRLVTYQAASVQVQGDGSEVLAADLWPARSGALGESFADDGAALSQELPIEVKVVSETGQSFNWTSYMAVSMAVLFLMFAVTSGGRTLLAERRLGTLPRLLTSPIPALTVLIGKMSGIVLTGLLQMLILWGATSLIGAYWGEPLAVVIGILTLVMCASGVGALISAWAKTAGQASAIGTAVTLVGSAFSGSFFPRSNLPAWVQSVSLVTPNAWGIEIFSRLQLGRGLGEVLPQLGGVLVLTLVYYGLALVGFRRQFD